MPLRPETLQKILPVLLRPIVRFCLNHSVKLGDLIDTLKLAFVRMATEELERRGEAVSASKISVVTGVHRKDVADLLHHPAGRREPRSVVTKVLGAWQSQKAYVDRTGKPRVLTVEGKGSEFFELVTKVSADLNPYTVLFELERVGLVERTRNGIKLVSRLYIPRGDAEKGLQLLASDAEDLYRAVEENVMEEQGVPNLHIKTEYDNIPAEHGDRIREWFFKQGSAFHQQARGFLSQFDRDSSSRPLSGTGTLRVAVGSFSLIDTLESK